MPVRLRFLLSGQYRCRNARLWMESCAVNHANRYLRLPGILERRIPAEQALQGRIPPVQILPEQIQVQNRLGLLGLVKLGLAKLGLAKLILAKLDLAKLDLAMWYLAM